MPIPADVCKISLVGSVSGGEEFVTSFWITGGPADSSEAANAFAASIVALPSFATLLARLKGMMTSDMSYTQLRVYRYQSGGNTADFVGFAPIAAGQGTSTGNGILQVAMVATLNTLFAGRRYRGRMYFPATGMGITAHQFATTAAQGLATDLAAFFSAVNSIGLVGAVSVVSRIASEATGVSQVSVDTKPDIQRRRAEGLVPTARTTASLT